MFSFNEKWHLKRNTDWNNVFQIVPIRTSKPWWMVILWQLEFKKNNTSFYKSVYDMWFVAVVRGSFACCHTMTDNRHEFN